MTTASLDAPVRPAPRRRAGSGSTLTTGSALGLGIAVTWFSLLVLIPLTAIIVSASGRGWSGYIDTVTAPQTMAAIKLTVGQSALVTLLNVVMGTLIAWVLVRDRFWGKRILDVVIDIPFALPTIVAGLVLLGLYGANSPLGLDWAYTQKAVFLALAFVTLPFIVRTVQPVLEELETDAEEAAASLGAKRGTIFRRVILPSLTPAITAGAALAFARAIAEYGSLVLLSGNKPFDTEVASVRMLSFIENGSTESAAAVASLMLAVALFVIVVLDIVQRRVSRHA
jgi:sulfate/thiosulfate transport system permease protein